MIETKITFTKRPIKLRALTLSAVQMAALGAEGLNSIRERTTKGIGSDDSPMKPLKPQYERWKSRQGLGSVRNLIGPGKDGHMLDNLSVRYADNHQVKLALTTRSARIKAWANEQRASWLMWSDSDATRIVALAEKLWNQDVKVLNDEIRAAIGKAA